MPTATLQRAALAPDLQLDRPQARERAPRDDLAARAVGAGEHHRELALARVRHAVEAAKLAAQRGGDVGERLLGELLPVGALDRAQILEPHEQATERGAVALGARDLLLDAIREGV